MNLFPGFPEARPEKPEEKHIRFAEDILTRAVKSEKTDKAQGTPKGKRKGKVIKYKEQDESFIDDEIAE